MSSQIIDNRIEVTAGCFTGGGAVRADGPAAAAAAASQQAAAVTGGSAICGARGLLAARVQAPVLPLCAHPRRPQ